jgi:hypothetical protein
MIGIPRKATFNCYIHGIVTAPRLVDRQFVRPSFGARLIVTTSQPRLELQGHGSPHALLQEPTITSPSYGRSNCLIAL